VSVESVSLVEEEITKLSRYVRPLLS